MDSFRFLAWILNWYRYLKRCNKKNDFEWISDQFKLKKVSRNPYNVSASTPASTSKNSMVNIDKCEIFVNNAKL